jgi:hypothetical protein
MFKLAHGSLLGRNGGLEDGLDAISVGHDPKVAKKKRARTVREVEGYVKKLGKAGSS